MDCATASDDGAQPNKKVQEPCCGAAWLCRCRCRCRCRCLCRCRCQCLLPTHEETRNDTKKHKTFACSCCYCNVIVIAVAVAVADLTALKWLATAPSSSLLRRCSSHSLPLLLLSGSQFSTLPLPLSHPLSLQLPHGVRRC